MVKQRRLKSIIQSHVDPEQDENIRGTKIEIDGKLQKILGFLEVEDANLDRKESTESLIQDIRNYNEFLYSRYDNLTKELKEEFYGGSSSSSDSSNSDDPPKKNGKRNGKVKNKIGENAFSEIGELERKLEAAIDEKEECVSSLMSKNVEFSQLEEENQRLQIRNFEIEKALIEKEGEIKKYEDRENESSAYVNSLEEQLRILGVQKSEADGIIERQCGEISEFLARIESLIEELSLVRKQNSELVNKMVEYERDMNKNMEEGLKSSEKEVEQLQDQIRNVIDSKNQDIMQLEELVEDLKIDLEIKEDEINTLMDNMRTTEVKQRLTSQKLKITEEVLADKEEKHQSRVEILLEEKRVLEDVNASLSKMASEVCEKMSETLMGIDMFSVKFEEDFGHLESRIYEITNEFKVIMNWITGNKTELDQLKLETVKLVEQLKEENEKGFEMTMQLKEENEKGFEMTIEMGVLQAVLQNGEDERRKEMGEVEKMIGERDGQIRELERKMCEKDSEILSLNEKKREAIKELCIIIDYYRSSYNDLKEKVLKARGERMQIGA